MILVIIPTIPTKWWAWFFRWKQTFYFDTILRKIEVSNIYRYTSGVERFCRFHKKWCLCSRRHLFFDPAIQFNWQSCKLQLYFGKKRLEFDEKDSFIGVPNKEGCQLISVFWCMPAGDFDQPIHIYRYFIFLEITTKKDQNTFYSA